MPQSSVQMAVRGGFEKCPEGYASILVKFREIREAQTEQKIAMLKKMASDAAAVAEPSKKKRRPRS